MYVITPTGRQAWESQDASIPEQYRRFLWLIDVQGDARAVRGLAHDHAPTLLSDWLQELEELGFIEARPAGVDDATIPLSFNQPSLQAGADALAGLAGTGAYLALRRNDGRQSKPTADMTVLIVEDDPDQLALADLRLTMAGYRVRTASTVHALVKSLTKDEVPDLLLLDVLLPDGNGLEVLGKIRRHPKFSSLPIIMLTAAREPSDIGKGLALGADGYVIKPYSKNIINAVILKVLNG
jgi:CheY-like chemotaxis protein